MKQTLRLMQMELGWSLEKCKGFVDGLTYHNQSEAYPVNPVERPEYVKGFGLGLQAYVYKSSLINTERILDMLSKEEKKMKRALIVVDMSNDFVHDNGGLTAGKPAQEIVPYILKTAQEFFDNGDCVVFAMDAHEPGDKHFELWPEHNVIGTWGRELYGELKKWHDSHSIYYHQVWNSQKRSYDAFNGTHLNVQLRNQNVEEVHVVGVCTDICDYLTIAGADAAGFKTAIHPRGCATFTENGPVFIEQMKLCFHTRVIE